MARRRRSRRRSFGVKSSGPQAQAGGYCESACQDTSNPDLCVEVVCEGKLKAPETDQSAMHPAAYGRGRRRRRRVKNMTLGRSR